MQITEVLECHNKTVTRLSSSQRKSRRLSGKLHCLNFVFPAENETLGPVCLGCEASSLRSLISKHKFMDQACAHVIQPICGLCSFFALNSFKPKQSGRRNQITVINNFISQTIIRPTSKQKNCHLHNGEL